MTEEQQIGLVEEKNDETRIYEAAFHIIPSLEEGEAAVVASDIRSLIESKGGKVLGGEAPLLMRLAYPMQKDIERQRHTFTSGYFGWNIFEATGEIAQDVKKSVENNKAILRSLVIKTEKAALDFHKHPAHATTIPERPATPLHVPPTPQIEKSAEPMTVEAMDAEIAKLVVE